MAGLARELPVRRHGASPHQDATCRAVPRNQVGAGAGGYDALTGYRSRPKAPGATARGLVVASETLTVRRAGT
ncbi:hypothetical protein caldi_03220 [Caldinitratiruptor microaerophilus]|uniref:Uncharacterized protein n=1 Tax=Caldinitratiruptor microaerophilus TaxID=671077 RepID=A0AA35CKK4_9FIRM|nr:hypothetical protein caldi_03220 [Caldinitratiruptor microaerophilus]